MGWGEIAGPWSSRFRALAPIRTVGAFHSFAAVSADGGARVVVVGARAAKREEARAALRELTRVHGLLEHPMIPRATYDEAAGEPLVELACDAVADGHTLVKLAADAGARIPYDQADALFTSLRIAMQAAHAVIDPASGAPVCLGRVSLGNMLFARDGRMSVVGFGHNVALAREDGTPDGSCAVFQAPEVALGAPPSPSADYVAVLLAARSLMSFADLTAIARVVAQKKASGRDAVELYRLVRYFDKRWIAEMPGRRPPIEDGVKTSARLRAILGTRVDVEGLTRTIVKLLGRRDAGAHDESAHAKIVVAKDGRWAVAEDGSRRRLGRGAGRILVALADHAKRRPGEVLRVWDLVGAGWPGEKPIAEAGANRVYVALARLRKLGFQTVLQRHEDGYRLDPGADVSLE